MCSRVLDEWGVVIDNFHARAAPKGCHFFLTHLHEDHMSGLHAKWTAAPLHVSEATMLLMRERYGRDAPVCAHANVWEVMEWNTLQILGRDVEAMCVPAHHCTGSVMWIFRFPTGARVVFTGDFRATEELMRWRGWADLRPVSLLFYDSSLAHDPQLQVPTVPESVEALHSVYRRLGRGQRMAILAHTGGTEQLVAAFCVAHNVKWYVDESTKRDTEVRIGLRESARRHEGKRADRDAVWCVGDAFRAAHAHEADRWVYVRPSVVWFMCHRDDVRRHFREAIPDETNTFRVCYSTHSSYDECQRFIRLLNPRMSMACVESINPGTCSGSSRPNREYMDKLRKDDDAPLRPFKSSKK